MERRTRGKQAWAGNAAEDDTRIKRLPTSISRDFVVCPSWSSSALPLSRLPSEACVSSAEKALHSLILLFRAVRAAVAVLLSSPSLSSPSPPSLLVVLFRLVGSLVGYVFVPLVGWLAG